MESSTERRDSKSKKIYWINSNGKTDEKEVEAKYIESQEKKDVESSERIAYPTTYTETLLHVLKGNLGSGLFAMGDAIRNAGIILGPSVVIFLGFMCTHCMHLLLNASKTISEKTSQKTLPDFARTVELCFENGPLSTRKYSKLMRRLVNIFLCITQFGFCCVYFVFVSTNIKQVADIHGFKLDVHIHMLFVLIPILLTALVRNLKYLAPLSAIANVFLLVGVVITFYYIVQDVPSITERDYVSTLGQFPLFFGTALFAFEGIGLVLPLRNEMKDPDSFQKPLGVLNIGMVIVSTLYTVLGFMAYLKFGDEILGSVTLNLPENDILGQSVKVIISIAITLSYALQFYIPIEIMWPGIMASCSNMRHPVLGELAFRTIMVLVTFVLAEAIPYLSLFISLVGAVSSTALALIFPPILEFITKKVTCWMILKNVIILLIGVVGCLTGTYESINSIINAFQAEDLNENH